MMEKNLFVYIECSSVKHVASRFSVRKNVTKKKKKKKVTPGWTDISGPGPVSFLSRSSMYYIMLTLHNSTKLWRRCFPENFANFSRTPFSYWTLPVAVSKEIRKFETQESMVGSFSINLVEICVQKLLEVSCKP